MRAAESTNAVHQKHVVQEQAPISAEEIALKKNTDCVYFLASPLTCKKGNECEFRHSESARINPRDCWFWLSGSCLNRDCPFRHPPLDVRTPTVPAAPQTTAIKRTPCYYYHQGYCAKGDRCPFMHGVSAPPAHHQIVTQTSSIPETTVEKEVVVVQAPPKSETTVKPSKTLTTTTTSIENTKLQKAQEITRQTEPVSAPKHSAASSVPGRNGLSENEIRSEPMDSNGEDEEGSPTDGNIRGDSGDWEESSPGFDVLVDDEQHYTVDHANDPGRQLDDDTGYEFGQVGYDRGTFERPTRERYEQARFDGGIYEFERSNDGFDHIDYDRPRFEQPAGQDFYRNRMDTSSYSNGRPENLTIRERLNFNNTNNLDRRAYLDNNDLRNLLEKRRRVESVDRFRGEAIHREFHNGYRHHHPDDYDNRLQEHRRPQQQHYMQPGRPNGRRSRERSFVVDRRYDYPVDNEVLSQHSRSRSSYSERRGSRDVSISTTHNNNNNNNSSSNRQPGFRKAETRPNGSSDFAPPKSLAEIRAEKRKFRENDEDEPAANSLKRCNNYAPRDSGYSKTNFGENFSGPKPLSEILQEKRKTGNNFRDSNHVHQHHVGVDDGDDLQQRSLVRHASSNGLTNSFNDQLLHLGNENSNTTDNNNNNNNSSTGFAAPDEDELSDEEDDDFVKKLGGYFS